MTATSSSCGCGLLSEALAGAVAPVRLLGVEFAGLGPDEVLERLAARPPAAPFVYVVTPNADHLNRLRPGRSSGALYDAAALRLLDSRVVARLARLFGLPAPPVVTGSDLTASLFDRMVAPEDPLAVLGGSAETAAALRARYGLTRLVHHDPPMGFDRDPAALEAAIRFLEDHPARFCLSRGRFAAAGEWSRRRWSGAARPPASACASARASSFSPAPSAARRGRPGRRAGMGVAVAPGPAAPGAAVPGGQPPDRPPALARSPGAARTPPPDGVARRPSPRLPSAGGCYVITSCPGSRPTLSRCPPAPARAWRWRRGWRRCLGGVAWAMLAL